MPGAELPCSQPPTVLSPGPTATYQWLPWWEAGSCIPTIQAAVSKQANSRGGPGPAMAAIDKGRCWLCIHNRAPRGLHCTVWGQRCLEPLGVLWEEHRAGLRRHCLGQGLWVRPRDHEGPGAEATSTQAHVHTLALSWARTWHSHYVRHTRSCFTPSSG